MTKTWLRNSLSPLRHFTEHLVGVFGKLPRENDLDHKSLRLVNRESGSWTANRKLNTPPARAVNRESGSCRQRNRHRDTGKHEDSACETASSKKNQREDWPLVRRPNRTKIKTDTGEWQKNIQSRQRLGLRREKCEPGFHQHLPKHDWEQKGNKKNLILEEELKAQNGSPTSQNKNRNKSLTATRRK
jgi:hypothetical protein